jgi:hypothetical protein
MVRPVPQLPLKSLPQPGNKQQVFSPNHLSLNALVRAAPVFCSGRGLFDGTVASHVVRAFDASVKLMVNAQNLAY